MNALLTTIYFKKIFRNSPAACLLLIALSPSVVAMSLQDVINSSGFRGCTILDQSLVAQEASGCMEGNNALGCDLNPDWFYCGDEVPILDTVTVTAPPLEPEPVSDWYTHIPDPMEYSVPGSPPPPSPPCLEEKGRINGEFRDCNSRATQDNTKALGRCLRLKNSSRSWTVNFGGRMISFGPTFTAEDPEYSKCTDLAGALLKEAERNCETIKTSNENIARMANGGHCAGHYQ